jgi:hypothetical protein
VEIIPAKVATSIYMKSTKMQQMKVVPIILLESLCLGCAAAFDLTRETSVSLREGQ